jgi:hypothetical protein
MSRGLNWTDVLSQKADYVLLKKNNRLQILVRPDHKQLRRRGKRSWVLVAAIQTATESNGHGEPPDELREAVLQALVELTSADQSAIKKVKKGKKAKRKAMTDAN